jgi:hypothetical protein
MARLVLKERTLRGMCYDESEIYVQQTNTTLSLIMDTIGRVHVKSSKEKENLHLILLYLDCES